MKHKRKPPNNTLGQHRAKLGAREGVGPCPQVRHPSILSLELTVFFTFYFLLLPMTLPCFFNHGAVLSHWWATFETSPLSLRHFTWLGKGIALGPKNTVMWRWFSGSWVCDWSIVQLTHIADILTQNNKNILKSMWIMSMQWPVMR